VPLPHLACARCSFWSTSTWANRHPQGESHSHRCQENQHQTGDPSDLHGRSSMTPPSRTVALGSSRYRSMVSLSASSLTTSAPFQSFPEAGIGIVERQKVRQDTLTSIVCTDLSLHDPQVTSDQVPRRVQ
jgi:hypothetical protein